MSEEQFAGHISAKDFLELSTDNVTVVDVREPDQIIAQGEITGALHIGMAELGAGIDAVPHDRPAYVICATGDWSAEVAELLAERGIDAYNVDGGYDALRRLRGEAPATASEVAARRARAAGAGAKDEPAAAPTSPAAASDTEPLFIDAKGLKCPGPIVATADALRDLPVGARVLVEATEDAFASDIESWAGRTGNELEDLSVSDGVISASIRKGTGLSASHEEPVTRSHEKTFVVFSGDLDKTIAAFIMANGGAAMDRPTTMFFTFWGLNILRKAQRVRVRKNFIEKMFGWMMPRGTRKLGLSRMNMLGAGPKMIRWLMAKHGISSLEELISDAQAHGVRILACQMSMDIMGIKKEELLDDIEYVGVGTMLASAERSDLTFFI